MIARSARMAHESRRAVVRTLLAISLLSSVAEAGHAPLVPEPRSILLRPDAPEHIVIGTRRGGYFVTRDAGATWSWMCEAGVGYDDEEVYPGALLVGGTLVVSTGFGGIAASADGCGFSPWLPSEQPFVADVRAGGPAGAVLALEARGDGSAFVNRLWQSADGFTWQAVGPPFAPDTLAASFAISDAGDLYVGVSGPAGAELLRSQDWAETWQRARITADSGVTPRVVGAHGAAAHARVVVVADSAQVEGLATTGDLAVLSVDGGQTFAPLLQGEGDLSSWSLSGDGGRLAIGGEADGIHVLLDASQANLDAVMTQVSALAVHALAWDAAGRLYAAGHEAIDGFSVGVSEDDGRSFQSAFALCQVQGPLACPESSSVGAACLSTGETGWDVRKEVADSHACGTSDPNHGSAAGASSAHMPEEPQVTTTDSASPDCELSRRPAADAAGALLFAALLGAAAVVRRRPRRRELR